MIKLEPGQLWVMRIHAAIFALVLAVAAIVFETAIVPEIGFPRGLIAGITLLLILYLMLISPGRHYRAWGYRMDEEDLRLRRGVWVETHTIVPLDRVQHLDLSQGPIERAFGVSRLIVHTAGTQFSRVVLPGLSRPDAERMRDEIRTRIGREEA
ncbi:MAG TPA: PH domain-containing protein [Allosphingosinicella sp.]|nr:PH domain-containing protein [Allosphingosinicella sp.]